MRSPLPTRLLAAVLAVGLIANGSRAAAEDAESSSQALQSILEKWSTREGGNDVAVPWLFSFVEARVRDRGPTPQTREARQIRKVIADNPAVYPPVIGLYMKTHLLAVRRGRRSVANYLRLETVRLIDEYMDTVRSEEGWRLGSRFLTSLAAHLRDSSSLDLARALLDEALDVDPENVVALYAAAAIQEKYGNYWSASNLLRRLLDLQDLYGARLRLALCRARMGRTKEASRLLSQLAHGDGPDWVRAISYQEWSQLRLREGDPQGALDVSRQGHEALPHDESLAVLSAFMAGPRDPASRVITQRLTTAPTGSGPTARGLYNLWPPGISENESRLEGAVRAGMPLLVQALASPNADADEPPSGRAMSGTLR